MGSHRGTTVLDVLLTEPDRSQATNDQYERKAFELSAQTGPRVVDAPGPADVMLRDFTWVCFSRSEVKTMRAFIEARQGRALPFWLVTWSRDFELTATITSGGLAFKVHEVGYADNVFDLGNFRRHLAIKEPGKAQRFRTVLSAVNNGDGTETLNLEQGIEYDCTPACLLSFLRFSRLDTDLPRIDWSGGQFATARLPVRELPLEAPA